MRYGTYDATGLLGAENVIGLSLGNGWYRGRLGWEGKDALYGNELGAFSELTVVFDDGHRQFIATDESWRAGASATTANSIYDGQTVDARRESRGWAAPGFDDSGWLGVHRVDFDLDRLDRPIAEPVVRYESIKPQEIWTSPSGKTLIDFGQNLVGWLRFTVQGRAGQVINVRHAEVLEHGGLGVRRSATRRPLTGSSCPGGTTRSSPQRRFTGFGMPRSDLD